MFSNVFLLPPEEHLFKTPAFTNISLIPPIFHRFAEFSSVLNIHLSSIFDGIKSTQEPEKKTLDEGQ